MKVKLEPLTSDDREQFIKDNQEAFNYGAMEEFHIVEFYNSRHPDPNDPDAEMGEPDDQFPEGMFRFEKTM